MAFLTNQFWYCGSTKYSSVTQWASLTLTTVPTIVRQLATPTVGNERCFVATVAGTTGASEPTWTTTQGAKTASDGTVTWIEITGKAGVNGDITNTSSWPKNTAVSQGVIIKDNTNTYLLIVTTAGTTGNGSQPTWNTTAGVTTSDGTVTWTSLGAASGFGSYAAPWARLSPAFVATVFAGTGDTVYVSNNHAETQATSISYLSGTNTQVICVNDSATPPTTLATTASITTTGTSSISIGGAIEYFYGLVFNCGTGSGISQIFVGNNSEGSGGVIYMNTCTYNLLSTSTSNHVAVISNGSMIQYTNCSFVWSETGQSMSYSGIKTYFISCTFAASGTVPGDLFNYGGNSNLLGEMRIRDSDLSAITGTLFNIPAGQGGIISVENCKLGTTNYVTGSVVLGNAILKIHNSSSSTQNYNYYYNFGNGIAESNTSIYNESGATDGTTNISWEIITNTGANYYTPFQSEEIAQWNASTGSGLTATIQLTTNTALTNATCWATLEYLGNSSYPEGSIVSSQNTLFASPTGLTLSGASWAGTAQTYLYQIALNFTPQMIGLVKMRIYVGVPSTTIYIDPYITIT